MQVRCLLHSRPWASGCHGSGDVAHGAAKCFLQLRSSGGGQGRRYCPGFTDKKGNISAAQRAFKSEPDLEVLKGRPPNSTPPKAARPKASAALPEPSPGQWPRMPSCACGIHTWGWGGCGLAHLAQRVAKVPHQQGHVLVPRTELGTLPTTGKGVAVDPLHPVHHGLGHRIKRSLLGKLRVDHGGDLLGVEGAPTRRGVSGPSDCRPQRHHLYRGHQPSLRSELLMLFRVTLLELSH